MLTPDQRRTLVETARQSIAAVFESRKIELAPSQFDPALRRPAGAFVTLTTPQGDLRGCIGSIAAVAPLYLAVSSSAVNAAFRDPRFQPVQRSEFPALGLEISVMSPLERVFDVSEIEVGRDGLIITRDPYAGLLLPQVATEWGWDSETFLSQTCLKAGLPPDAWRLPGTRIERFSAEVFR
ncbi:MAG TPA: AmmeMemoRadiSam system protein A [Thermoanaerobaculia bacterium]|nr:AmmeMemoRadiSam system protein A [Thermoanaerobaculia bacterium]